MTPIYLQRAAMHCALGDNLHSAAQALQAGQPPQSEPFLLHKVHEPRPYLYAAKTGESLSERLDRLLGETLGANPQVLDDCLLIIASTSLDISELEALTSQQQSFRPEDSTPLDLLANQLRQRWGFAAAFTLLNS